MSDKSIDQIIQETFNHPIDCGIEGCEITEAILDMIDRLKDEEACDVK